MVSLFSSSQLSVDLIQLNKSVDAADFMKPLQFPL